MTPNKHGQSETVIGVVGGKKSGKTTVIEILTKRARLREATRLQQPNISPNLISQSTLKEKTLGVMFRRGRPQL